MPGDIISSSVTGIEQLVYAIMTDEVLETYGAVKSAPPVININVAPKTDSANQWASNRVVDTATGISDITVDAETQDLPLEVQADLLGHVLDALTGTLRYNLTDKAPYVALGYKRTKANGKARYVWIFKVKFQEITEESKTQEGVITFQTPKITGLAIANKNGDWKDVADEDTKGTPITDYLLTVPSTIIV